MDNSNYKPMRPIIKDSNFFDYYETQTECLSKIEMAYQSADNFIKKMQELSSLQMRSILDALVHDSSSELITDMGVLWQDAHPGSAPLNLYIMCRVSIDLAKNINAKAYIYRAGVEAIANIDPYVAGVPETSYSDEIFEVWIDLFEMYIRDPNNSIVLYRIKAFLSVMQAGYIFKAADVENYNEKLATYYTNSSITYSFYAQSLNIAVIKLKK